MDVKQYLPDIRYSGLIWVGAAFVTLSVCNALTLIPGRDNAISDISANPWGPVLGVLIYDTPYTIAGLLGLIILFSPVLFGTFVPARRRLSMFFWTASISIAVVSGLVWDRFYAPPGVIGVGSSAAAIAGQAIVTVLAAFGLLKLWRQDTRKLGRMSSYWWHAFAVIYATLILTNIWFVVFLQTIFVPTQLYNWRVHEFAFLIAIGTSVVYVGANWSDLGLDGKLRVDESLLNFHFDDLNDRFPEALPKFKVVFVHPPPGPPSGFDPVRGEVWMSDSFRGLEYAPVAKRVDDALLYAMVRAAVWTSGKTDGTPEAASEFDLLAKKVGINPET